MTQKIPGRKQVGTQLDEDIYRQIRSLALLQGKKAGELIDEACRDYLAKHGIPVKSKRTK